MSSWPSFPASDYAWSPAIAENNLRTCSRIGNLGSVDRAKDLPDLFLEHEYVDEELAATWKDMIGFRNVLVHEYADIDPTDPWESKRKAFSHQMGTEHNREQQRISEPYSRIGKRVYDVLQNRLDDIRRLRRVFGRFL